MLIEKQMKYFFYHRFPFFMYLPALIISEESYQTSNRFLEGQFGPWVMHWADNSLKSDLKCFKLSILAGGCSREHCPWPGHPARTPGLA